MAHNPKKKGFEFTWWAARPTWIEQHARFDVERGHAVGHSGPGNSGTSLCTGEIPPLRMRTDLVRTPRFPYPYFGNCV